MTTVTDIDKRKQELNAEIEKLEQQREALLALTPDKLMADEMHSLFCTWNHTDGCDWYYGSWGNPTHAHNKWLSKAQEAIAKGYTVEQMSEIRQLVRG
ncbi:MAG: hypothetical protein LC687_03435 [Actinobacteria bacterium]|nr:hypothetical protein [Actinomycetota bacterium]MCA1806903.1 hypothetical protein [Actinomycetota bacterium]